MTRNSTRCGATSMRPRRCGHCALIWMGRTALAALFSRRRSATGSCRECSARFAGRSRVSSKLPELPHFLAPAGVPGAATNLFGWVAAGYVEGARAAAAPTLLPACVNDARDDVSSPTFIAYARERRGAECLDGVLAILALVSSQALFVADRAPGPRLRDFLAGIRSVFPPADGRPRNSLGAQAGRLAGIFSRGALTGELDFGDAPLTRELDFATPPSGQSRGAQAAAARPWMPRAGRARP